MSEGSHAVELLVDGRTVAVPGDGSLLDALRDVAGARSVKDGCSPQGQCGCCTVLVDGAPRLACVTPVRRVAGKAVTTVDGLADRDTWAEAFCATGASQCGFCTPGIVVRLSALRATGATSREHAAKALAGHVCRCTGWLPILDAWTAVAEGAAAPGRDHEAASRRATLEGGTPQVVAPEVALGRGGFAADTAPEGALVAVRSPSGWICAPTLAAARVEAGKVQGRRSTVAPTPPLDLPPGDWALALRTSWVDPAYLEVDASWCEPGGVAASPAANGGAFGAKVEPLADGPAAAAPVLAAEHGRAVLALWAREDCARLAPKRPPLAAGLRADGTGVVRVARTPGIAAAIRSVLPGVEVEEVELAGPPTSVALRAAGWAEAAVLRAGLLGESRVEVTDPVTGGWAAATVTAGRVNVEVAAGEVLDEVVLRSYCTGAAHQALGWVTSEALAVGPDGEVLDLTLRSTGILRPSETPTIDVTVRPGGGEPVRASDAVFAAVAGAVWVAQGCPPDWPTRLPVLERSHR